MSGIICPEPQLYVPGDLNLVVKPDKKSGSSVEGYTVGQCTVPPDLTSRSGFFSA
jgi:hypothetical protein